MKEYLLALILLLIAPTLKAQQPHDWEKFYDELASQQDDNNDSREEIFEILSELEENPINLNTATKEDLERIPFLTAEQIEDIQAYIYRYHGMHTLSELMLIESLDATRRNLLANFVYVKIDESLRPYPSLHQIATQGTHTLIGTGRIPFYDRQGDRNGYLGYKYSHTLRYNFHYRDYFQLGFVGSQDAGEPFFAQRNAIGYDHYSFYAEIRRLKVIENLVVGRYKANFGYGLVISSYFNLGKTAALSSLGRQSNTIRPYASRSQAKYLQGAAATIRIAPNLKLSTLLSHRPVDATLNPDGTIKTLLKTNYHRTPKEMERKNNATQTLLATNLNFQHNALHIGTTALFTRLSRQLSPDISKAYLRNNPTGNNFWNVSLDYSISRPHLNIAGETATGKSGGIATINKLSWRTTETLSLLAIQRYYAYKYSSLLAESFGAGGHTQNESGLLIGANYNLGSILTILFYTDYAYFSHPRFRAHTASHAWDNMLSIACTIKHITISARYRLKIDEKDAPKTKILTQETTQRARLSLAYSNIHWQTQTQFNLTHCNRPTPSLGYMISQAIVWHPTDAISLNTLLGYFHTDNFATRIYIYERGPRYTLNFPSFFGKGFHYAFMCTANLTKHLMLLLKLSTTKYFDRSHISSGLQQIDHSSKIDLDLQLRYKF